MTHNACAQSLPLANICLVINTWDKVKITKRYIRIAFFYVQFELGMLWEQRVEEAEETSCEESNETTQTQFCPWIHTPLECQTKTKSKVASYTGSLGL